jgi:hypothetical protein
VDKLTRAQAAIIGTYTGIACGPFEDIQALGDELMGEPTWTHQYASQAFADALREAVKSRFLALCADRDNEFKGCKEE